MKKQRTLKQLTAAIFCALLLLVLFPISAQAFVGESFKFNNVTYRILTESESSRTVQIGEGGSAAISKDMEGLLEIPDTVEFYRNNIFIGTYTVTAIANYAFYDCKLLADIILPSSITNINYKAFSNCKGLTNFIIPDSVTTISNQAFSYCEGIKSITIPESVTTIENEAFRNCISLASITLPNSLTSLGQHAFEKCESLTSITIPGNITTIEKYAFANCWRLESVIISEGVKNIDDGAFDACLSLNSVMIPHSVTVISKSAFSYSYDVAIYSLDEAYAHLYAMVNDIPWFSTSLGIYSAVIIQYCGKDASPLKKTEIALFDSSGSIITTVTTNRWGKFSVELTPQQRIKGVYVLALQHFGAMLTEDKKAIYSESLYQLLPDTANHLSYLDAGDITINGRIVDSTGKAIADAIIFFTDSISKTEADGYFSFQLAQTLLLDGDLNLTVKKDDYANSNFEVSLSGNNLTNLLNNGYIDIGDIVVFLENWEPTYSIFGQVCYQASKIQATVTLYDSNDREVAKVNTKDDGTFTLEAPADTGYKLVITKPCYLSYTIKDIPVKGSVDIREIDIRQMAGDINGDGVVNAEDLTHLLSQFNKPPFEKDNADIDGSGVVNAIDLTYLLAGFNKKDIEVIWAENTTRLP
ncbi:MAG: leucine-rich repeat protein [Clostridiales bacterium]|nr:leucine-rich repeat protein [Clostridiales bacterium]